MSRKQEIYREILGWALPSARNTFARFRPGSSVMELSPQMQRSLAQGYEVAQFVHNLYVSILDEEFTDHDIWFLNNQARSFYERNDDTNPNYALFAYYIQELIKEVPISKKRKLLWVGPEGDYSWARPTSVYDGIINGKPQLNKWSDRLTLLCACVLRWVTCQNAHKHKQ